MDISKGEIRVGDANVNGDDIQLTFLVMYKLYGTSSIQRMCCTPANSGAIFIVSGWMVLMMVIN